MGSFSYKVTLDPNGVPTILSDEPEGIKKLSIKIKRNEDIKGLYQIYTSSLQFWGDGYDYLLSNLTSVNDEVEIQIIKQDETGAALLTFDGIIYARSIEVDVTMQKITTSIDNNNLSSLILNKADAEIRINNGFDANNNSLSNITPLSSNFHGFGGSNIGSAVDTFLISDVFQYLLDYISGGTITLDSMDVIDTTIAQHETRTITYSGGTLASGERLITQIVNYTGNTTNYITAFTVDQATTVEQHADELTDAAASIDVTSATTMLQSYNPKGNSYAKDNSDTEIDLETWMPYQSISVSTDDGAGGAPGSGISASVVKNTTDAFGFKRIAITNGWILSGKDSDVTPTISLSKFIKELSNYADIVLIPRYSTTPKLDVKLASEAYDSATTIMTLNNVNKIKWVYDESVGSNQINISNGSSDKLKFSNQTIGISATVGESLDLKSDWIVEPLKIAQTKSGADTNNQEDDIFMFELNSGDDNTKQYAIYKVDSPGGSDAESYGYNGMLINTRRIKNWLFSINADTVAGMDNDSAIRLKKKYTFDWFMTDDQLSSLMSSPDGKILFSQTDSGHTTGYVYEIDIDITTLKASFQLQTE